MICYNLNMKSIDLEQVLFHGLAHILSPHKEEKSLSRLDRILKCGAILSRNYQELMLSELGLEQNKYAKIVWNGEDYISICRKQGSKPDRTSEAFSEFVESGISIILDSKILDDAELRVDKIQEGEVQIKDTIPSSYFKGISVLFMSDKQTIERTQSFIDRGMSLKECEDILIPRYKVIRSIRDCLDRNGFTYLQIFSIYDGNIITNPQQVLKNFVSKK